ncbi:MAG: hypothetical protein RLZZ535_1792, partial [Cyanobacteriota bacterium]
MRERILGLPLMLAAVLTLVWPQVPSARELNRMLARENLLWTKATFVLYLNKDNLFNSMTHFFFI